jgi:hypothetical protein
LSGNSLPGWPWRLFATALALACMGLGLFAEALPPGADGTPSDSGDVMSLPDTISIRILNGCGVLGLAGQARSKFLSARGLTVWTVPEDVADARADNYTETVIISHVPDLSCARAADSVLLLPDSNIVWELGGTSEVDLTIILGTDIGEHLERLVPYSDP